jgi:hypothetical protein
MSTVGITGCSSDLVDFGLEERAVADVQAFSSARKP